MKLKSKNKKGKPKHNFEYPDEKNPFWDENVTTTHPDKNKKREKVKSKADKKIAKDENKAKSTKKNKQNKKSKKLDEKRTRAISNAVLTQIAEEKFKHNDASNTLTVSQGKNASHLKDQIQQKAVEEDKHPEYRKPTQKTVTTAPIINGATHISDINEKPLPYATKQKSKSKLKRPSEGDIKALRAKRDAKKVGVNTNPFELEPVEEKKEYEQSTNHSPETITLAPTRNRASSRRRRTSSVLLSSRERSKKKRLRLVKKIKRTKKKKSDNIVADEENGNLATFNPRPSKGPDNAKPGILQEQVKAVTNIVSGQVLENLEKRNSNLSLLMESTEKLEEFAHSFAETAHENRLKQQTKARCCGLFFAKFFICRHICVCEGKVKRKKQTTSPPTKSNTRFTSRAFADQADDSDDAYGARSASDASVPLVKLRKQERRRNNSSNSGNCRDSTTNRASGTSLLMSVQNSKLLKSLNRSSTGTIEKETRSRFISQNNGIRPSSTGGLDALLSRKVNVPQNVKTDIQDAVSEYDQEDLKLRAAELLLLDHEA